VIGEWAGAWDATREGAAVRGSLAAALYTAEVMEFGKVLGIDSMQYFGLSDPASFYPWNTSLIVEDHGSYSVRPSYYVRMLYRDAWGDRFVPVPGGQTESFSVYASKDASHDYLMLINRSADQPVKKTLSLLSAAVPAGTLADVLMLPRSVTVIRL
jgi:hypothetical protein